MEIFHSFDGAPISYRRMGAGRPVILLHGFLGSGETNFVVPGIADRLVRAGFEAILPDLRGHGASRGACEPHHFPPDAVPQDQEALVAHLDLRDYDLVGYSLGARAAARVLVRNNRPPRRCVVAGIGDRGVFGEDNRVEEFLDLVRDGERSWNPDLAKFVVSMLETNGLDAKSMVRVLEQQEVTTPEELGRIKIPVLLLSGSDDNDNGSVEGLAALLGDASVRRTAGDHFSAFSDPAFAEAIVEFLSA